MSDQPTEAEQRAATYRKTLEEEGARERTIETIPTPAGYFRTGEKLMQEQAAAREPVCLKCDGSGFIDPDGTNAQFCSCEQGKAIEQASIAATYERRIEAARQAAPVIRHPGKTHEEILTFLADYEGTLGLGTDEKDAIRWARGRIADLTGDVARYMEQLSRNTCELRLVHERYAAFVREIQAIVDYHKQQGAA